MTKIRDWIQKVLGRSDIYFGASLYMRRWTLGPRGWWGLRLHHTMRGDADREYHDHPFWFVSFMLRGCYIEHRPDGRSQTYNAPALIFRRATDLHRLELPCGPVWTFLLRGSICRQWGFLTESGWVPWTDFVAQREASLQSAGTPGSFAAPSSLGMHKHKTEGP